MHPNPVFHTEDDARNLAFAADRGFGVLAVDGPLLSHIPFTLSDGAVEFHLVRSNPIARALRHGGLQAKIAVSGPDGYISPDWYEVPDQVPTWNYVAVHISGMLELRPQDALRGLLDRQAAHFEEKLLPKTPWTYGKMTPEVLETMMRQIVPCRMSIDAVDGTWKLNQNKPDDVRLRAAGAVAGAHIGQEIHMLAALMRGIRED
jgi:transcriptional regulator